MARLFTGIELGAKVRERVAACQAELAAAIGGGRRDGLRLVRAVHLHLTLVFLGEIDDARVPAVVEAMTADLPLPPFDIEFASCGVFPPHGHARVLWLGVGRGAQETAVLFEMVSERLETVGVPRERRPFTPHLTLGRWRDRALRDPRSLLPDIGTVAVQRVSAVTLFHSRLLPQGPEHQRLAQARLSGPAVALH
jgi:RNA 2',3'-cyclic 3'-phosphodiesterase